MECSGPRFRRHAGPHAAPLWACCGQVTQACWLKLLFPALSLTDTLQHWLARQQSRPLYRQQLTELTWMLHG